MHVGVDDMQLRVHKQRASRTVCPIAHPEVEALAPQSSLVGVGSGYVGGVLLTMMATRAMPQPGSVLSESLGFAGRRLASGRSNSM